MSHTAANKKPLYLSEEEVLALLELSMTSTMETSPVHDHALLRLSGLLREFLSWPEEDEWTEADSEMLRERLLAVDTISGRLVTLA